MKGDPFWMKAGFNSECRCGACIKRGDDLYYYPKTKKALCTKCGKEAQKDFEACVFDEEVYNH